MEICLSDELYSVHGWKDGIWKQINSWSLRAHRDAQNSLASLLVTTEGFLLFHDLTYSDEGSTVIYQLYFIYAWKQGPFVSSKCSWPPPPTSISRTSVVCVFVKKYLLKYRFSLAEPATHQDFWDFKTGDLVCDMWQGKEVIQWIPHVFICDFIHRNELIPELPRSAVFPAIRERERM